MNGEPVAKSGDRPSKYDSGDFWNHFYVALEHRFGKLLADQFREWLRVWAEETNWHRVWQELKDHTEVELRLEKSSESIRMNFARMLKVLREDKAFWERFLVVPPPEQPD